MFPNAYAPMIHPDSIISDGEHLYYALSTWDVYNVFLLRTDLSELDFSPGPDTKTTVESRIRVDEAVKARAINDQGTIDEQRLEEAAAVSPAAPEPVAEPAGR